MTRRCKYSECRKELPPARQCITFLSKKGLCSEDCAVSHGLELAEKNRKRKEAKDKAKARGEVKELNRRDLGWQHKQTQKAFNRMRVLEEKLWFRERGMEPECISCGKTNMDWCCGHLKTRGAQSNLRYDRLNTFLQCNRYCNKALSGNIEGNKNTRGYKQGLVDRFGEDEARRILDYLESNTAPVKWDCAELESFRAECSAKARELQQDLDRQS